ncbi:unnamed protein product [Protopolystoma xenopodis]|uniref:Uncharacterized protein n=1 Tax=Protopolystoma xenopodis TaxID=117903 RepID=A0A448WQX7_9PLAT|nr:unnamed protein product [Protopolystoma xenopodis]
MFTLRQLNRKNFGVLKTLFVALGGSTLVAANAFFFGSLGSTCWQISVPMGLVDMVVHEKRDVPVGGLTSFYGSPLW